ncbi:lytic transglycosylase domain-containing protein [Microbacterium sediminis]|uniref:Uncharacterized protein n=1 Tax=Microbacterium sediminis TaxID=904291 RepID=A0A1B9NHB8_9MICO|nr:lytic transglycosylase domain-containing protein [Microbacterium sediminis]OCG76001.1 hypothetical protein A7J15_12930 [Microbacterium sediminis]QBR73391.1 lytic transglycosylase domain-containing protein [Microbacterium sediminis]
MPQTLPRARAIAPARHPRSTGRNRIVALAALGVSVVLTGSAVAAEAEVATAPRSAVTADLTPAPTTELTIPAAVAEDAEQTLEQATLALEDAPDGVETGELKDYVHALSNYDAMPSVTVVSLVDQATAEAEEVVAETASVKEEQARQAAEEKRAAEEAARAAEAAAQAAAAATTPQGAQAAAADIAASQYGWGADQFGCLVSLWNKESGWNYQAANPSSGAYGIPQSLPGSKMATVGADWATNPVTQIRWGLDYISRAYGTPCAAWGHSQAVNWY